LSSATVHRGRFVQKGKKAILQIDGLANSRYPVETVREQKKPKRTRPKKKKQNGGELFIEAKGRSISGLHRFWETGIAASVEAVFDVSPGSHAPSMLQIITARGRLEMLPSTCTYLMPEF
jgi:hypothetical protein